MTFERDDERRPDERTLRPEDVDADIVVAAQRDLRAFAPLYEKYFDPIYGYCLRSLRDSEAAADATSQTFAKALKALPRYKAWSFRSWLFAIAHNVIVDSVRRRKPTTAIDEAGEFSDRSPGPEDIYLSLESQHSVGRLLTQLTNEQRQVVELRMAGLSGLEIADAMDSSVGAVKALQFRAYSRLRKLLSKETNDVRL
ncbi:MAG: RNA polymerase sigma factor [Thermomicrobiales bacterium]